MALDRQSIEKRDFPIGRRGYEPAAVDAHLASVAREVDALKRRQPAAAPAATSSAPAAAGQSLASIAGAQVQAIVEAAESSAAAIEREARDNAEQTARDAAHDAQRTREEAVERSQEHVGKVHEATALMLQRVDAMESELTALVESLRTGANRLNADLSLLSGNMGELYAAAGRPASGAGPADDVVFAEEIVAAEVVVEAGPEAEPEAVSDEATVAMPAVKQSAATQPAAESDARDIEGARLIALNMALNGQSREETDRYLSENFDLNDRGALLDEVYAAVER